ncbi:MAG: hypothetical protein LBI65_03940, partial [Candidatus Symbiothrix sp.]|nr:hypothetical protein [Candidatus Symbiothrix sp.]
ARKKSHLKVVCVCVCVKKYREASKFWKLKKMKCEEVFFVIFIPIIKHGTKIVTIFDCAKEMTKK